MDSQLLDTDAATTTDIGAYIKKTAPRNSPTVRWWVIFLGLLFLSLGISAFYDFYHIKQVGSDSSGIIFSPIVRTLGELSYQPWMFYASIFIALLGFYCVVTALRPRPGVYLPTAAITPLWLRPLDIARIASHQAKQVSGVLTAQTVATKKKITVTISTIAPDAANFNPEVTLPEDIPGAVTERITQTLSSLHSLPQIRVIHHVPSSESSSS